jgi:antitoxin (DNA-binding transcriptional repressor) of toxin-antitoxin stability system
MDRVAAGEEVVITRRGQPRIRLSPAVSRRPSPPAPGGSEPTATR